MSDPDSSTPLSLPADDKTNSPTSAPTDLPVLKTAHAERRLQQRGINPGIIQVLLDYGVCRRIRNRDSISYSMNRDARKKARRGLGDAQYKVIEKWFHCYLVVCPKKDVTITVGHRKRRLRR